MRDLRLDRISIVDAAYARRRLLYLVGWCLILASAYLDARAGLDPTLETRRRYTASFILFHIAFATIALTLTTVFVRACMLRRRGGSLGFLLNVPVIILTLMSGQLLQPGFSDPVCGQRVGCFHIAVANIPTDTVFEIWTAPSPRSSMWTRLEASGMMNYSEDGSYLADPHLLLSGNERTLVLARGGFLVDAIDTASGKLLSRFVSWGSPNRDVEMQANSDAIRQLLERDR